MNTRKQKPVWFTMSSVPRDGTPVLVQLDGEIQGHQVVAAKFHINVSIIGGLFAFDAPKPLGWMFPPKWSTPIDKDEETPA